MKRVTITAVPFRPWQRYWCAGRMWTATPVTLRVVEDPKPSVVVKDAAGRTIRLELSDEIDAAAVRECERDRRMLVADADAVHASEMNAAKSRIAELEESIEKARLAHQGAVEYMKAGTAMFDTDAEAAAIRVGEISQELAATLREIARLEAAGELDFNTH